MKSRGRIRVHMAQKRMSFTRRTPCFIIYIRRKMSPVAKVMERTADAVICYRGDREPILRALRSFPTKRFRCRIRCWNTPEER